MQFAARLARVTLGVAICLIASAAVAQTFPAGSGTFNTRGKFRVSSCDRVPFSASEMYTLDAAGVLTEVGTTPILSTLAPQGSSRSGLQRQLRCGERRDHQRHPRAGRGPGVRHGLHADFLADQRIVQAQQARHAREDSTARDVLGHDFVRIA